MIAVSAALVVVDGWQWPATGAKTGRATAPTAPLELGQTARRRQGSVKARGGRERCCSGRADVTCAAQVSRRTGRRNRRAGRR